MSATYTNTAILYKKTTFQIEYTQSTVHSGQVIKGGGDKTVQKIEMNENLVFSNTY